MSKIAIVTPVYGSLESASVALGYHAKVCAMLRHPDVKQIDSRYFVNCDLVRARSRAVRMVLESPDTDILFWDSDVVPHDIRVIEAMYASEKEVIGVPYPKKKIRWDHMADHVRNEDEQAEMGRQTGAELEASSLDWPMRYLDDSVNSTVDGPLRRVAELGMGFMMIRRGALEKMTQAYKAELTFLDAVDGKRVPTVALFQLMIEPGGELLSEDYSFCRRWSALGGDVWAFADPAVHVGAHAFGANLRAAQ